MRKRKLRAEDPSPSRFPILRRDQLTEFAASHRDRSSARALIVCAYALCFPSGTVKPMPALRQSIKRPAVADILSATYERNAAPGISLTGL